MWSGLGQLGIGYLQGQQAQKGLSQAGKVNLETMDPIGRAQLNSILQLLGGGAGGIQQGFSKQAAQQDSMGLVQQIFDQYQKTALPQIYNAQTGAGAYNSTGGQLLANDAYAQTVNKAAQTVNQNVLNYSQAYKSYMDPLLAALGISKGSQTVGSDTRLSGFADAAMKANSAGTGNMMGGLGQIFSAGMKAYGGFGGGGTADWMSVLGDFGTGGGTAAGIDGTTGAMAGGFGAGAGELAGGAAASGAGELAAEGAMAYAGEAAAGIGWEELMLLMLA
jgi:hypothetical protein